MVIFHKHIYAVYSFDLLMKRVKKYFLQESHVLPMISYKKSNAVICDHCNYVNDIDNSFCTNCGYPLQDKLLINSFYKKLNEQKDLLFKAQNAVFVARAVLYIMALCLFSGILFLFSPVSIKYILTIIALTLSALFFFLATWSKRNPFAAIFSAFIILTTFCAINLFNKLTVLFTTSQGIISMLLCIALLVIMMKGLQGAYKLRFFKQ